MEEIFEHFRPDAHAGFQAELPLRGGRRQFTTGDISLGQLACRLGDSILPETTMSPEDYFSMLSDDILPYAIDTGSPVFIGHMTSALPAYIHELSKLISRLNQNMVKIETSKSLTLLERQVIAMLHRLFYGFPEVFYRENIQQVDRNLGIMTGGGTLANISALLSARNRKLYRAGSDEGTPGLESSIYASLHRQGYSDMVLLGSELMHYSFRKAASVLGLGANNLIFVKSDGLGRICLPDLEEKICVCRKDKLMVLAIVGVAGSTERGSIDPLAEMGRIASRHGIHFHVDAAWGGALIFSGKHRHLLKGIEMADSITFCGHKQLYLPQGISICLFKDPGQLNYSSIQANYQATAGSLDLGRFTIEGSRPALSICLHASLHILGPDGYGLLVDNGIEKAVSFSRMIGAAEGLELISRQMNIVNYRFIQPLLRAKWRAGELDQDMNEQISRMNKDIQECQFLAGRTFVSRTVINHERYGRILVFRAVLSNPLTTEEDLFRVLEDQASIADKLYSTQTIPQQYDEHK